MSNAPQMSFADMLSDAETDNRQRRQDRAWDHLPGTMDEAVPYMHWIITEHHNAMMCMDFETVMLCAYLAEENLRSRAPVVPKRPIDGMG